jgi:DTW domain-containing protein
MSDDDSRCPSCSKSRAVCVCDRLTKHDNQVALVVLRHPQEDDVELGTAPLLAAGLRRCFVQVGLSWPSLAGALAGTGLPSDPSGWAVVFPNKLDQVPEERRGDSALILDKRGALRPADAPPLVGLLVLDGTWTQGKALWWRNAWLLKLSRVVLHPKEPSIYGKLRKEPSRNHVSTLEAACDALVALGEPEAMRAELRRAMRTMVQRARDASSKPTA